ncbi:NUDIX domain-containing protein, partial [Streptomyces sp. NPDC059411]|uniref:NUDIX domain-containing protein n=1 Tax=Streptomyces sp. NPDC059411 TaxID=3346825 RepID=UPI0036D00E18
MTTTDDYATYIASLPRVLAGAAVLYRDAAGRVLLVEPNYREGWALPGGTIESDEGESPRAAARRESAEEIGLDLPLGRLLAVDWSLGPDRPPRGGDKKDRRRLAPGQNPTQKKQEEVRKTWR